MRPPAYLIREGVSAMPCIGDGRQSGTSGSPSILNASPEAAAGGGLALLQTGDRIRIVGQVFDGEGKVIPDNSLVMGQPGKVVRDRDPAHIAVLQMSAEHYVQNWKRFVRELTPA